YVALLATARTRDAAGNGAGAGVANCGNGTSVESGCTEAVLPELAYQGVRARFRGLEAEGSLRLLQSAGTLDLQLRGDLVRADNLARQGRVPAGDVAVAGYTMANAAVTWKTKAGPAGLLWYARMDNITDRLGYSATSILTQTAPGRVPMPGRSVRLGVRADF